MRNCSAVYFEVTKGWWKRNLYDDHQDYAEVDDCDDDGQEMDDYEMGKNICGVVRDDNDNKEEED